MTREKEAQECYRTGNSMCKDSEERENGVWKELNSVQWLVETEP